MSLAAEWVPSPTAQRATAQTDRTSNGAVFLALSTGHPPYASSPTKDESEGCLWCAQFIVLLSPTCKPVPDPKQNHRRLLTFVYDGLEFVEQREVALPEAAASLQSVRSTVFVALQTMVVAADAKKGSILQQFPCTPPLAPCTRGITPDEVALTRDKQTSFMAEQARPTRRGRVVTWTAPPQVVAVSGPYILAFTAGGVQVQLVDPFTDAAIAQDLPCAELTATSVACTSDGSVFAATATGGLAQLKLASYIDQAEQMLEVEEYEEALAMCRLVPAVQVKQEPSSAGCMMLWPPPHAVWYWCRAGKRPQATGRSHPAGVRQATAGSSQVRGCDDGIQHERREPSVRDAAQLLLLAAAPPGRCLAA